MSFSVGIVGLPNVGKSTLFKALTKQKVDISNYPFCTISPNIGIVRVPDERLQKISEILNPQKTTPTVIEFVDIAGLVKGAHKGEGLGNQFLAQIREVDAILEVVRYFEDENITHVDGGPNPERDIETIKTELLMKDLETTERARDNLKKDAKTGNKEIIRKLELIEKLCGEISNGKAVSETELTDEQKKLVEEFCFLTAKPIIYVFNIDEGEIKSFCPRPKDSIEINLKSEEEASELSDSEKRELEFQSKIDDLISLCYKILDLITFYTIKGGVEARAWTLRRGQTILDAAGKVHTDFKEKFIKAEVINFQKLIAAGSWQASKEKGQIDTIGKEYIIKDGDIIEFKI